MNRTSLIAIHFAALAAACSNPPARALAQGRPAVSTAETQEPANLVVEWNRALLRIVRTPGVQPATIHPTRTFAMLHLAIRDAVHSIDRTPRLIRASSREASQEAAAAAAAHDVLVALYPSLAAQLDTQLQQSLAQVPDGAPKT